MWAHRLRRWTHIQTALVQRFVFAGCIQRQANMDVMLEPVGLGLCR